MGGLTSGTPLQGGKYIVKQVLGQGGFGVTYLADQVSLGREVAVKEFFMRDSCVRDEKTGRVTVPPTGNAVQVKKYRDKFHKEAQTLASLSHPNIVSVIDVWEENDTVYYSMPYVAGGNLKDLVKHRGKLDESTALRYVAQVAAALQYMHGKRLCHFDVKPANIMLDDDDRAVLIDFGICKHYDVHGKETSGTPIGMSEGYAPIEQYRQMVNDFSPASDVYALGATLYYLVTGKTPPSAINLAEGESVQFNGYRLSPSTTALIEQSMQLRAKDRPQSVDAFLSGSGITPLPDDEETKSGTDGGGKKGSLGKGKVAIITLLVLLAGGVVAYYLANNNQPYVEPEPSDFVDSTVVVADSLPVAQEAVAEEQQAEAQSQAERKKLVDNCITRYLLVLMKYRNNEELDLTDIYQNAYFLHDITGDGIPELWVKTGTCEADRMLYVYTVINGQTALMGETGFGHSTAYCGNECVLVSWTHMGESSLSRIKSNAAGTKIVEKVIEDGTYDYNLTERSAAEFKLSNSDPIYELQNTAMN